MSPPNHTRRLPWAWTYMCMLETWTYGDSILELQIAGSDILEISCLNYKAHRHLSKLVSTSMHSCIDRNGPVSHNIDSPPVKLEYALTDRSIHINTRHTSLSAIP